MGGKGGNSGQTQQTQQVDPWGMQQPYLTYLYGQARNLPQQQPYPFPGVVPWSPASVASMEAQTSRALQGSPLLPAAQQQNLATVQGDYLYGNPGFNAAFDAAQRQITPQVQGAFERAGRFGSGLAQTAQTRALGDAFASLYGQERGRQMQATALAPSMAQADYQDISRLAQVGAQQEAKAGEALADAMNRWGFQQGAPYGQLAAITPAIAGGFPGSYTRSNQELPQTSPLASGFGAGMMGYGLAQANPAWGINPWLGAGIGAGVGLLGGK